MNNSEAKVITFYSYKGGVGRTLALANTAFEAFLTNKKVFIIDNDLEASGVSYKLVSTPEGIREMKEENKIKQFTMADLLYYFTERIVNKAHKGTEGNWNEQGETLVEKKEFWFGEDGKLSAEALKKIDKEIFKGDSELSEKERFTIANCVHEFKESHIIRGAGSGSPSHDGWIKYIAAGSLGRYRQYWHALGSLDFSEPHFYDEDASDCHPLSVVHCIDWLIHYIKKEIRPDYIFIDARSGFSLLSRRVCATLSDQVFLFSSNSGESFEGLFQMRYEIYRSDKLNDRDTNVKFVYSRIMVDSNEQITKLATEKLRRGYEDVVSYIEYENEYLFGNYLPNDEREIFNSFKTKNPLDEALIVRHSPSILREEKIVLANVAYDEPLARDMLRLFQNIIGYKFEDMFLGLEYFIKYPGLYFELFKNHVFKDPTEEHYFDLLRFYGNLNFGKSEEFYSIVTKYFRFFIEKPAEINDGIIDLFLCALEKRNTGDNYNYIIGSDDELIKLTDLLTGVECWYDLRRRWLKLKIYSEDEDVKSAGMRTLEGYIYEYLRNSSEVSENDKNAYIKDYLEIIANYGKASGFTNNRFDFFRSYCEKHYVELRVPYYLAEFKVLADKGDLNVLLDDRNKLSILIKDSTYTLNALLNAFSGDNVSNDVLYNFITFLTKMFEEGLIDEEEKIVIRKVFFEERKTRLSESFVQKASEYLEEYMT